MGQNHPQLRYIPLICVLLFIFFTPALSRLLSSLSNLLKSLSAGLSGIHMRPSCSPVYSSHCSQSALFKTQISHVTSYWDAITASQWRRTKVTCSIQPSWTLSTPWLHLNLISLAGEAFYLPFPLILTCSTRLCPPDQLTFTLQFWLQAVLKLPGYPYLMIFERVTWLLSVLLGPMELSQ